MAEYRTVAAYVVRCRNCSFSSNGGLCVDPAHFDVTDPKLRAYHHAERHLEMHNQGHPECHNPEFEYRDTLGGPSAPPPEGPHMEIRAL